MKTHALLTALLAAAAVSAHAASPAALTNLGAEPDCKTGAFFTHWYERKTAPAEAWVNVMHKGFHPMELELVYGVGLAALDWQLEKDVKTEGTDLSKKYAAARAQARLKSPNQAVITAYHSALRERLRRAVQTQQARTAAAPGQTLHMIAARQVACRMSYLGKRADLTQSLLAAGSKPEDKQTSIAYWTAFHRAELAQYLSESASLTGPVAAYKTLWDGMKSRAELALASAADKSKQAALIAAAGVPYVVPGATSQTPPPAEVKPAPTQAQTDPLDLTDQEKQALPDKLLRDFREDKRQIEEANKGKKPEELAAALKPTLDRYREIIAVRRAMPATVRQQFEARVASATTRQARDGIINEYKRVYSPRRQLDQALEDMGRTADGSGRRAPISGDVVAVGSGTTGGLSAAERAAQVAAALNAEHGQRGANIDGREVPNLTAGGIHTGKGDAPPADTSKDKLHLINGAKLGLWGALLGAFMLGPLGAVFLGALMIGLGTVISKEVNK